MNLEIILNSKRKLKKMKNPYLKNNKAGNGRISLFCQKVIIQNPNLTNTEIAFIVAKKLNSKTTKNCVSWYKCKMKLAK
jgi:hypothetical protein